MKKYSLALILFFTANICSAQILKDLGKRIKGDAQWRVRYKTDQQVAKGLDSLAELPKKIKYKKKSKSKANNTDTSGTEKQTDANNSNTKQIGNYTASNI